MLKNLWNDEAGVIISAELVLVLTISVLAMVVGLAEVSVAVITELNDVSNAIGALSQTFAVCGFGTPPGGATKTKGFLAGSAWTDTIDDCDLDTTCDIIVGATGGNTQVGNAVGGQGG